MNFANIKLVGPIMKVISKNYEGKITLSVQFLVSNNTQGFTLIPLKVEPELLNGAKDGDIVEVNIRISSMNSNLFYSAVDKIKIIK